MLTRKLSGSIARMVFSYLVQVIVMEGVD